MLLWVYHNEVRNVDLIQVVQVSTQVLRYECLMMGTMRQESGRA